ncbi:MAG: nuclear transport factor 2 family protein [Proteobacteria bacterium]|nr:nuclear transport factor 2 family protein [Pseudomonadota bacterium]HQR04236.1 nuclear transport factor 2 family protein [Rhodocyclaceae bacterium]
MSSIEARLQALEDLEAIRTLKARYLDACDRKDPEGMRDCFSDGVVDIDYGPIGKFSHRDQLAAIFRQYGCHPHVLDTHHGSNPQITLGDGGQAAGTWSLYFQQINLNENRLVQMSVRYEDEYRKLHGVWKITKSHSVTHSAIALALSPEQVKVLFAAPQPPGLPV